jgi:DNA-3-methyladenine glycosylase
VADRAFARALLDGDLEAAARSLIGARLVRRRGDDLGRRVGRIVEVEAYDGPEDRASHSRFGPAGRSAPMFGPPGRAYVYRVYGMYTCLNVVVGPPARPAAVLLRAVEPLEGIAAIRAARLRHDLRSRRSTRIAGADPAGEAAARARAARVRDDRLAAGPGLICAAFSVEVELTGTDLCDPRSPLQLAADDPADEAAATIVATPRIGIDYAGEPWISVPWRYLVADSPAASGPRRRPSPAG